MEATGKNIIQQNDFNLLESRLKHLRGKISNLSEVEKSQYEKVARGFESMFVHLMMKEMKSAMLGEFKEGESDDFGADTLSGYTDLLFADEIANSGNGVGIASMLYKQFTGTELPLKTNTAPDMKLNKSFELDEFVLSNINIGLDKSEVVNGIADKINKKLSPFEGIIEQNASEKGIPKELIKAVIRAESAGNPNAVSKAGAKGLMQLMDETASDMGVSNAFDPKENIAGGAKYLSQMIDKYEDLDLALAAYNAGPGNVDKYGGIPPFKETENYVKKVKKYLEDFLNL